MEMFENETIFRTAMAQMMAFVLDIYLLAGIN